MAAQPQRYVLDKSVHDPGMIPEKGSDKVGQNFLQRLGRVIHPKHAVGFLPMNISAGPPR